MGRLWKRGTAESGALLAACALGVLEAGCPAAPRPAVLSFAAIDAPDLSGQVRSAVRLRIQDSSSSMVRSGVLVGDRGYILTAFSNVGLAVARQGRAAAYLGGGGRPGTLYGGGEDIRVEVFDSPYESQPSEYTARVVRGDMQVNFALLRIVASEDGPLSADQRFDGIELGAAAPVEWGSTLWVLGSSSQAGLHVEPRTVAEGVLNSKGEVAGYYIGGFPSFMDGAPAYDAEGRFVGLVQSSYLRAADRIPGDWLADLAAGIEDRRIDGMPDLPSGEWLTVDLLGDTLRGASPYEDASESSVEDLYFSVPDQTAGTVKIEPPVDLVAVQGGSALGAGTGELFVPAETQVYLIVRFPRSEDPRGLSFRVRFSPEGR
ncbi:MAG: trypsin-like peptidase domain-containing protein [Deltaproteobacteria bacterium]|nr:trypsin-like peptidase domain-containing protein [Deltaproteobacteria bacterium]